MEVVEFGMKLMSRSLSGQQARDIVRDVATSAYPLLTEGVDYQIPSSTMFLKYRNCLYSVSNNRMVRAFNDADEVHLIHDASTKKGKSIFQSSARIVKDGVHIDAPIGFNVLKNGESKTEADAIDCHLHSTIGGEGVKADKVKIAGLWSDGAGGAMATTEEMRKRREEEVKASAEFESLSEEEKQVVLEVCVGRCGNHNLNLLSAAVYKNEEAVLKQLIKEDEDAADGDDDRLAEELCTQMGQQYSQQDDSDRPAVTQLLRACVFLFECSGGNAEYHLNEGDQIRQWMKGPGAAVLRSARRPKQLKALKRQQKAREVSEAEREQLEDSTFEDEGITWKVMKVQWDDSLDSIIVFYYDMQSAEREMIDEDD